MKTSSENRAMSATFRVFGGAEPDVVADVREVAKGRGMNLAEFRVLAVLLPATLLVVIGDALAGWWGTLAAWVPAVPAAFVALNFLPLVLGMESRRGQWVGALAACVTWAGFHHDVPGVAGFFSWLWIGIAVLDVAAGAVLAWRWQGGAGIAWRAVVLVALHVAAVAVGWLYGWAWGLACGAVVAAFFCRAVLDPGCQWLGRVYRKTDRKDVLVTIDDGPDTHDTPVLLDLLDKHGAKAVFFMIGEKVRAHPELAREVVLRGHEIGNHTLTHPQGSFWCAGPWRTRREIEGAQRIITEVTGRAPRYFRAPVGHRNLFTHPVCATLGLEVMGWNRRGYDAVEKDAEKVLERILPELSRGDIVLLHEATPIAEAVVGGVLERRGNL